MRDFEIRLQMKGSNRLARARLPRALLVPGIARLVRVELGIAVVGDEREQFCSQF